jgi:prevent-host-death family protein
MTTVSLEQAQARLPDLVARAQAGEEIVITRDEQPVARLTGEVAASKKRRRAGTLKGTILHMAEDFDAPLEEFKEYLP